MLGWASDIYLKAKNPSTSTFKIKGGAMKFWAILLIVVDGFWGGRCSVCVGGGEGYFFTLLEVHMYRK